MPEGDDRVPAMGGGVRGAQERLIAAAGLRTHQLRALREACSAARIKRPGAVCPMPGSRRYRRVRGGE